MDITNQKYLEIFVEFSKNAVEKFFNNNNLIPIEIAIHKNQTNNLFLLLKKASPTTIHNALVYSVHDQKLKIIHKILKNFYDKNSKLDINIQQAEVFKCAIYYQNFSIIKLLINFGSNIHIDNDLALIKNCIEDKAEVVDFLIKNGADMYADENVPLIYSAGHGHQKVIEILFKNQIQKQIMQTLSDSINDIPDSPNINTIPDSLDKTNNITNPDNDANNMNTESCTNFDIAMLHAIKNGHLEIVCILLNYGANPNVNNSEALIWSIQKNNVIAVNLLLKYQINVNILDGLALKKSCANGYYDIVKLLIDYQSVDGKYLCDLNAGNGVAIRWSSYKGHVQIVKLLLESKTPDGKSRCDIHIENDEALKLATKYGHTEIINLINNYSLLN